MIKNRVLLAELIKEEEEVRRRLGAELKENKRKREEDWKKCQIKELWECIETKWKEFGDPNTNVIERRDHICKYHFSIHDLVKDDLVSYGIESTCYQEQDSCFFKCYARWPKIYK